MRTPWTTYAQSRHVFLCPNKRASLHHSQTNQAQRFPGHFLALAPPIQSVPIACAGAGAGAGAGVITSRPPSLCLQDGTWHDQWLWAGMGARLIIWQAGLSYITLYIIHETLLRTSSVLDLYIQTAGQMQAQQIGGLRPSPPTSVILCLRRRISDPYKPSQQQTATV